VHGLVHKNVSYQEFILLIILRHNELDGCMFETCMQACVPQTFCKAYSSDQCMGNCYLNNYLSKVFFNMVLQVASMQLT